MGEERATLARNNGRTSHDTPSEKRPELVQLPTGLRKERNPEDPWSQHARRRTKKPRVAKRTFPAAWRTKCRAPNARIVAHANGRQCLIRSPFAGRFQVGGWPLGRGRAAVPLRTNVVELEDPARRRHVLHIFAVTPNGILYSTRRRRGTNNAAETVHKESKRSRNADRAHTITTLETTQPGRKARRHKPDAAGTKSKCIFCDNSILRPGPQRPPKYRKNF